MHSADAESTQEFLARIERLEGEIKHASKGKREQLHVEIAFEVDDYLVRVDRIETEEKHQTTYGLVDEEWAEQVRREKRELRLRIGRLRQLSAEITQLDERKVAPESPQATLDAPTREAVITELLRSKGLSKGDLAIKAGVKYHTVADWAAGTRNTYSSTREKLAKALEIPLEELP